MTAAALLTTTMLMILSSATTAVARQGPPEPKAEAQGSVITVTVSGSGYTKHEGGSSGGAGIERVTVPAPCWMYPFTTGKAYYEGVKSGEWIQYNPDRGEAATYPEYEKYKDDDKGHWYVGMCDSANWPNQDDLSGWWDFSDQFFPTHRPVYVPANQTPPIPPVPPELLRDIAINNLTLPNPELDWNPKRIGSQGTLVNLDTWFWLDNAPTTLQVHAAAGGNEATVTATFAGMDITAPGEEPLSCPDPGTAYTSGAHATTCALAFSRASVALGAEATPVTVQTRWTGTWAANNVDQGPLTPQPTPVTATVDIHVDEVQTLVTGAQ